MSRQYTDEERAQARGRMRRLRADAEYAQHDRDAARERMRRLRRSGPMPPRPRSPRPRRTPTPPGSWSFPPPPRLLTRHSFIGNRQYKKVYDSWYTLRRRALIAGELDETLLTLEQWVSIVEHYGNLCVCCGNTGELSFDHVLPVSMAGSFTADNIQPLCLACNMAKRNRHIDYRPDQGAFAMRSFSVR